MVQMIYITCKDEKEATEIANKLVEEKLVACGNIIPEIKSVYWWKGKVEQENEALLLCKTTPSKIGAVIERVKELHSYDVPCVVSYGSSDVSESYRDWVYKEVDG